MEKSLILLLMAGAALNCSSCSSSTAPRAAVEPSMIQLLVKADPQLNRYDRNPHALVLCLYQLNQPVAFQQLAREKEGFAKLLECNRFDASVVNVRPMVAQPGQEIRVNHVRGEGARYLGIATGYYSKGKKVAELSPLPGAVETVDAGLLRIDLGPNEINAVRVE